MKRNSLRETEKDSNFWNGDNQLLRTSASFHLGLVSFIRLTLSIWLELLLIQTGFCILTVLLELIHIQPWSMVWVLSVGVWEVLRLKLLCSVNALPWFCHKWLDSSWLDNYQSMLQQLIWSCYVQKCSEKRELSISLLSFLDQEFKDWLLLTELQSPIWPLNTAQQLVFSQSIKEPWITWHKPAENHKESL